MKTSLDFEGPADLSVGEIRISNNKGMNHSWMATPGQREFKTSKIAPGYYVAEISPAGTRPQSVVFEVKPGVANTVSIPNFTALTASGGAINFLGVEDRDAAMKSVYDYTLHDAVPVAAFVPEARPVDEPVAPGPFEFFKTMAAGSQPLVAETREIASAGDSRLISVGLAIERAGRRESWDRFDGPCAAQLNGGRLAITIGAPEGWTPESGRRVRMSVAIQNVRVERMLLPLYRGGTSVSIVCSSLLPNDVTLEVLPVDPNIRAIWRALEAGTRDHAAAVRDHVLAIKGAEPIAAIEHADPWEAMLAALLFLRFPEEFGKLSPAWAGELRHRYAWAGDVFVIQAQQLAGDAGDTREQIVQNAAWSVDLLVAAQVRGSPYFNQSNQFFNELAANLAGVSDLAPVAHERIERARRRWQRELPLKRSAGASFSWLSRDQRLLKEQDILAPRRDPSGLLRDRDTTIVFKGRLTGGGIAFESISGMAPKTVEIKPSAPPAASEEPADAAWTATPPDCPALRREPGPADDPNKGRFGGRAGADGFRLSAQFRDGDSKATVVTLRVEADGDVALGESVWLCLHPTFNPEWVKVLFTGRVATLTVQAWGGFTVGAWIESKKVELECDLSQLATAPRMIREL